MHSVENLDRHDVYLIHGYKIYFVTDVASLIDLGLLHSVIAQDPTMNLLKEGIYKGWPSYR